MSIAESDKTVLDVLDNELQTAVARRVEVETEMKEATARGREQLREINAAITKLEKARSAITGQRRKGQARKPLVAATVAGPAAVEAVEAVLREKGRIAQAEVTRTTKLNSGTVSHALKALQERGVVRRTEELSDGRSPIWEFTGVRSRRTPAVAHS